MKLSKILFAGITLTLSFSALALPDISGNWTCKGMDPMQKKNFSISGEIKKTGDTYSLMNWKKEKNT